MYLLFTTSDKLLAKVIRWATGEKCSHVAILVRDIYFGDYVIHSNWKGVTIEPFSSFLKENRIIHQLRIPNTWDNAEKIANLREGKYGSCYDFGALLFFGIVLFCRRLLGLRKWPKQNLWQSTGMYLCTELVTEFIDKKEDSLITPEQLYSKLVDKQYERIIDNE